MAVANATRHAHNFKDLTGKRFGKLTVQFYAGKVGRATLWSCDCDCGVAGKIILGGSLRSGKSNSCGCERRLNFRHFKHGSSGSNATREYRAWKGMISRCHNPNSAPYGNYGGRGIVVCERWRTDFLTFLNDMGPCPPGRSIDRKDNDGNYEPGNCRWATDNEQAVNTRKNHRLTYQGVTQTISQWARQVGIGSDTLLMRIRNGWSTERALTEPVRPLTRRPT